MLKFTLRAGISSLLLILLTSGCASQPTPTASKVRSSSHSSTPRLTNEDLRSENRPDVRVTQREGNVSELNIDSLAGNKVLVDGRPRFFNGYSRYPNGILRTVVFTDKKDTTTALEPEKISELCEPESNQRFEYNPVTLSFTDPTSASAARAQVRAARDEMLARAKSEESEQRYRRHRREAQRSENLNLRTGASFDEPSSDAAIRSAAFKILTAGGLEAYGRSEDNEPGLEASIKSFFARKARDVLIASAISDAFPNLSEHQVSILSTVIGQVFEGRISKADFATALGKEELIRALESRDPQLANSAKVVDFLASIGMSMYDKSQR